MFRAHSQDHFFFHIQTNAHIGVTLFGYFSRKKTTQSRIVTFPDVCFSKPVTFHNEFMFFAYGSCFKHFSRFQATPLAHIKKGFKSRNVLETVTISRKHEIIVEVQRLRKADIMERNCSRLRLFLEK